MTFLDIIKSVFITPETKPEQPAQPPPPSLDDIRKKIFDTARNMEMRNREASAAEAKAQSALQKTFQPGLSKAQREKLLADNRKYNKDAKRAIAFANQLGAVLDTLENAEAFLELSETISKSDVAGAGRLNLDDLAKELAKTQAVLLPMINECRKMKASMDFAMEQFDSQLSPEESSAEKELMALYAQLDAEKDPVKRAAIQAEIASKNEAAMNASMVDTSV